MLRIDVVSEPVGGEDARENAWIQSIVQSTRLADVTLRFSLTEGRTVDLDNLARPAMKALRLAGYFSTGFKELSSLTATKRFTCPVGLTIESGMQTVPPDALLIAEFGTPPPSSKPQTWMEDWANQVARCWERSPVTSPVWLAISTTSSRSLVDLLKPVIDGLESVLGRDPAGRNRFCPNDHLVEWLQIRRVESGPVIGIQLGLL